MAVDFERAWQITRATEKEKHDERCSFRTHGLLCDCDILFKCDEFLDDSKLYGAKPIEIVTG